MKTSALPFDTYGHLLPEVRSRSSNRIAQYRRKEVLGQFALDGDLTRRHNGLLELPPGAGQREPPRGYAYEIAEATLHSRDHRSRHTLAGTSACVVNCDERLYARRVHLDVFCIDDSIQNKPTRAGMGKLVAVGGIHLPGENVRDLERDLDDLCKETGFPDGPTGEFKWSPGKELWMHKGLVDKDRTKFYRKVLKLAREAACTVIVIVEDATKKPANAGKTAEQDVVLMFLERVQSVLETWPPRAGIVLADRPSAEEDKFLLACLAVLQQGTDFTVPVNVAFNVIATSSHLVRLLQLADLVTSCSVAYISGESKWSPPIFSKILPMVRTEYDRRGGAASRSTLTSGIATSTTGS